MSGGNTNRPALPKCLKQFEPGDTLIFWKLERLSRNVRDFVIMADDLKERGIKLNSLSEHLDPDTTMGRAMMQIAAIFAEMERANIRERTRAGRSHPNPPRCVPKLRAGGTGPKPVFALPRRFAKGQPSRTPRDFRRKKTDAVAFRRPVLPSLFRRMERGATYLPASRKMRQRSTVGGKRVKRFEKVHLWECTLSRFPAPASN